MFSQLANMPILYRFMAGGVAAFAAVGIVYRMLGPIAAGLLMAALLVAAVVIFLYNRGLKGVRKRKASAFDKGLQADADQPARGKAESRQALAELSQRWKQATSELKQAGMNLYDLPWYLLIGEPQSGKSTTLRQSGLDFPVGTEALSGAGGTRNCDWWFTNEAVILDTAGRFTFQEKNAPDASEWSSFLKLLRKHRAACPINGVILTIPCTSLLNDSLEQREEKGRNIREKLTELQRELGVSFPVFILITKSDQILGFTEFFSRLSPTEQRQLMGWSMQGPFVQSYDAEHFHQSFADLCGRIHKWRNRLMVEDMSLTEVDKLYVFPEELQSLEEPLHDYLKIIFVKSQYLNPLFFRGYYFTSGLQQGRPVARACARMLRSAGGGEEVIEHLQKIFERSRAFFIRDFYLEKLFPERSLVVHSGKGMRHSKRVGRIAMAAGMIVLALTLTFLIWQGMRMHKGSVIIEPVAQEVHDEFMAATAGFERGEPALPAAETTADHVELATNFYNASGQTIARAPVLRPVLRDMHWLFVLQTLLRPQATGVYRELVESPPGASLEDPSIRERYASYVRLWSINPAWMEHTSGGEGGFPHAEQILWPPGLRQAGLAEATQEAFQARLGVIRDHLSESDLDFDGDRAIRLPLVPGALDPRENQAIRKEVRAIRDTFKQIDTSALERVVTQARNFKVEYGQALQAFLELPCGYADPQDDPFVAARQAAATIRSGLGQLEALLADNRDLSRSLTADRPAIEAAFDQLTWQEAAVEGGARTRLESYLEGTMDQVHEQLREQVARAEQPLREVNDVIQRSTGTLRMHPDAAVVAEGLEHFTRLCEAQNAYIQALAEQAVGTLDEVDQRVGQWRTNEARTAALSWAGARLDGSEAAAPEVTPGAVSIWGIDRIAGNLAQLVNHGDQAVQVEAMLAWTRTAAPEAMLSDGQIQAAALDREPPKGARLADLEAASRRLERIRDELVDFAEGTDGGAKITCPVSQERLEAAIEALEAVEADNRKQFVAYWTHAYRNWRPADWIREAETWEGFKRLGVMRDQELAQRIRTHLRRLWDHVREAEDHGIRFGTEMRGILTDVEQFVAPNSTLDRNANRFAETVQHLPSDLIQASLQLQQAGLDGIPRRTKLESIGIESASLNGKFRAYPRKALALLLEDAYRQFEDRLYAFLTDWRQQLAGRCPFKVDSGRILQEDETLIIPQADVGLVRDFFFGSDSLPFFLDKYGGLYEQWSEQPENATVAQFIRECLDLRAFLFGEDADGAYREFSITATYKGFEGKEAQDLREISERLDIYVPVIEPEPAVHVLWRSQRPGRSVAFSWRPADHFEERSDPGRTASASIQRDFVFQSMLERGARPNKARRVISGDFSVLAYVATRSGDPRLDRVLWPVTFTVRPRGVAGEYKINFDFVFERRLPTWPDWAVIGDR